MLGNASIDRSKGVATSTNLTTAFIGFVLCYQIATYIFRNATLDDADLDASCSAESGFGGGSTFCAEAQLFRGWHEMPEDAPENLEKLLEVTPKKSDEGALPKADDPIKRTNLRSSVAASSLDKGISNSRSNPSSTYSSAAKVEKNVGTSRLRGRRDSTVPKVADANIQRNLRASKQSSKLTWTGMKAWVAHHDADLQDYRDKTPFVLNGQDERLAGEWQGQIPVVACVTVLPAGQVTEALMKSFMDNYNSQNYDGDRKLVIVHKQDDQRAAEIVQPYIDGKSVIAATAFNEGRYMSSTSYRYGAWLARNSADVVAQWDFDARHHPRQLSMQVRAMVVSGRPASVLTWVTDLSTDGKKGDVVQGGSGQHGSMVGETSWMRKYWHPVIEEEQSVPTGLHARDVVQVDMPDLLAYHDLKKHERVVTHY